jgi:hypothetical protein
MKNKSIFIIMLGIAVLSFSACKKDFLSTQSPSEDTEAVVFTSTTSTQYALMGVYALLTQDQLYSARLSLNYSTNSDIEIVGADANSYNDNGNRGLSNYKATDGNSQLNREWTNIYKMIERANLCINGIRTSPLMTTRDSIVMKAYLGEALTLRSLGYFELVKHWGDVPFKAEPTSFDLSNAYMPAMDRDSIYDNLIADLSEAATMVPWVKSANYPSVERVTKGFVKGLLARIALFRGGYSIRNKPGFPTERGANWRDYYEIAKKHCKDIMDENVHQLNTNYMDVWKRLNRLELDATFNENLFEVANGLTRSGEMGYSIGVRFYTNSKYGFGNNANVVNTTAYYFYSFDQKDVRRDNTIAYYMYGNSSGEAKEFFQTNELSFNFSKWDQRYMGSAWQSLNHAASGKFGYGINWVIMRYSDVLLMFAEADTELNGGNPTPEAKQALKDVRFRAFSPADRAEKVDNYVNNLTGGTISQPGSFLDAIVNERAWEFGGEAIRKYDLIRWNLLSTKIEDQRVAFKKMLARAAPYNTLPQYLYYKYEPNNEIIDKTDINFYEDKGSGTIAGYTRVNWLSGLSESNIAQRTERINLFSSGLNEVVPNRHLFPIAGTVISESRGTLKNSYGF